MRDRQRTTGLDLREKPGHDAPVPGQHVPEAHGVERRAAQRRAHLQNSSATLLVAPITLVGLTARFRSNLERTSNGLAFTCGRLDLRAAVRCNSLSGRAFLGRPDPQTLFVQDP